MNKFKECKITSFKREAKVLYFRRVERLRDWRQNDDILFFGWLRLLNLLDNALLFFNFIKIILY